MVEEKNYLESVEKRSSWKDEITKDDKGRIQKTPQNIITFLENHPKYAGNMKYNTFSRMKEFNGETFTDMDLSMVVNDICEHLGFYNQAMTTTALDEVFKNHKYNPVQDYLKSLKWDGKKRVERLFIDMLGADDTVLNRVFAKKWMVAAIKRTMQPGCKFDNVIILQGAGGIGKSTLCERLAKQFFSEMSLSEIDTKDVVQKLNMTWIAIIDEMDNMNRKEMSSIKSFFSRLKDMTRLAYARNSEEFKRHCVFIGSINDETFLRDSTSNVERRFWVIKCNNQTRGGEVYRKMNDYYVDQLWAEAISMYEADPDQYLDIEPELYDDFEKAQKQHKTYQDDDIVDYLKEVLNKKYSVNREGELTRIEQFQDDTSLGDKYYINKIKGRLLSDIIRSEYPNKERSRMYLRTALEDEWVYKDAWFKSENKFMKAWVRVKPIIAETLGDKEENDQKKPYNPMDEFLKGFKI